VAVTKALQQQKKKKKEIDPDDPLVASHSSISISVIYNTIDYC
jgi:hypothetical protein